MFSYTIALRLPQPVCRRLSTLCYGIPNASWEDESNFIVSLFPLGELNDTLLDEVKDSLKSIALSPVTVTLNGIQHTAIGRSQVKIWVGLESKENLQALQKQLHSQLLSLGLHPGKEKLIPHVFLGNAPAKSFHRVADYLSSAAAFSHPPFECNSFFLLSSNGAPIEEYPLVTDLGGRGGQMRRGGFGAMGDSLSAN